MNENITTEYMISDYFDLSKKEIKTVSKVLTSKEYDSIDIDDFWSVKQQLIAQYLGEA